MQALRIGYASISRPLTMTADGTSTLDFALEPAATQLDIVQVTATGQEQSRRESGVATSNINVATEVPQAAVTNMASVLSSRAPGVVVQEAGGTTGSGARVRIRGSNSVSLSNDPLIIVDGVRVNNQQDFAANSIGVGGQVPSRLNDINQEEIDNIEIIIADEAKFGVKKKPLPREILARLRKYRGYMPEGFKFDREEAHERGWRPDEPQARPSKKRTA